MKKALIIAAMMALPTFAGEAVTIAPAPAPTFTSPCADSVWSWEVAGTYSWAATDPYSNMDGERRKKVNTYGADVTLVRALPDYGWFKNHALFLRLGYNWGDRTWGLGEGLNTKFRVNNFSIMPGYRMMHKITDNLSYHIGGSIGVTNNAEKVQFTDTEPVYEYVTPDIQYTADGAPIINGQIQTPNNNGNYEFFEPQPERVQVGTRNVTHAKTKNTMGFAASLELGLRYDINPCWNVFGAYQITMNTARTKFETEDISVKTKRQLSHGIRVGVGHKF